MSRRYSFRSIAEAKPNQVRGVPNRINRVLGTFGIYLVDTEATELLNISIEPNSERATIDFGNPKTGEVYHRFSVPVRPIDWPVRGDNNE